MRDNKTEEILSRASFHNLVRLRFHKTWIKWALSFHWSCTETYFRMKLWLKINIVLSGINLWVSYLHTLLIYAMKLDPILHKFSHSKLVSICWICITLVGKLIRRYIMNLLTLQKWRLKNLKQFLEVLIQNFQSSINCLRLDLKNFTRTIHSVNHPQVDLVAGTRSHTDNGPLVLSQQNQCIRWNNTLPRVHMQTKDRNLIVAYGHIYQNFQVSTLHPNYHTLPTKLIFKVFFHLPLISQQSWQQWTSTTYIIKNSGVMYCFLIAIRQCTHYSKTIKPESTWSM